MCVELSWGFLVRHSIALASCRTLSCRALRWTVPTVWWSKLLEFSWTLCWGSFLSLTVFADSSGWLSDNPWLSALRCLTEGGVALVFWVPRSGRVHGLRERVTCLRSCLWSSSIRDRNEDFPSYWWIWFLSFVRGPLPQTGAVFFGLRSSRRLSLLLTGWYCVFALGSSSVDLVCVGASTVSFSCVFLRDVVTLWVNSVFLSLLIANEGLHWWWCHFDVANPF